MPLFENIPGTIPINMLQWLIGAAVLAVFSYKSWLGYRHTGNRLSLLFVWFASLAGISLLFYGSSAFVLPQEHAAFRLHLLGDLWLYACLIVQAHILALIGFQGSRKVRSWLVAGIVALGSLALYGAATSGSISLADGMLLYHVPGYVAAVRGLLIAGLFMPLGGLFIQKTRHLPSRLERLKAGAIGLAYLGIGAGTLYRDWILGGFDSHLYVFGNIIFFITLLISLLLYEPRRTSALVKRS